MDLLSDPDFEAAVARAKAIGRDRKLAELSPSLLLQGFKLLKADESCTHSAILDSRSGDIDSTLSGIEIPSNLDYESVANFKMPVGEALRPLLSAKYQTLSEFIDALIKKVVPDDPEAAIYLELVLSRASAAASRINLAEITPDLFAVAALSAYLDGAFKDRPGISIHIALNKASIEELLKVRGWKLSLFQSTTATRMNLSDALSAAIKSDDADNKLLAAIDCGASVGAKLREQRATAIHEAGHAVASFLLRPNVPVTQISIIAIDGSDGHVAFDINSPSINLPSTRQYFVNLICILLAGGIAQQIKFGEDQIDEGALSDISRATKAAWDWIAVFGLDDEFGPISLPALEEVSEYKTGFLYNHAQRRLQKVLKECAVKTRSLLSENWHHVEKLSSAVLEKKILSHEEVLRLLIDRGLVGWPGVRQVRSRPLEREVRFAVAPGIHDTKEGPVRYNPGDAIVQGSAGESWPISRHNFDISYESTGGLTQGDDGIYAKRQKEALAIQLGEDRNVVLSNTRGILKGKSGDWIVDYGEGDLSLVSGDLFDEYYEFIV